MQGFIFEKGFLKAIFTNRVMSGVDPTQRIQVLMLPDSSSAVAHGTTGGHLPKQLTPTHPFPEENSSCVTKP